MPAPQCDAGPRPFRYAVSGISVSSELQLPLAEARGESPADVIVVHGPVAGSAAEGIRFTADGPADVTITFPGVARSRVRNGTEIIVDPDPGACQDQLILMITGAAFGVLVIQRGLLPLHASAIETPDGAVAFVGRSGAGKSTLAAWFARAGYRLLCDDLLVIGFDAVNQPIAWPHLPRLKLWDQSLDALDHSGERPRVHSGIAKYYVEASGPAGEGSLPFRRVYLLDQSSDAEPGPRRLHGLEALHVLMRQSHGWGPAAQALGDRQMSGLSRLLDRVEIYAVGLERGFDRLDAEMRRIETHMCRRGQTP